MQMSRLAAVVVALVALAAPAAARDERPADEARARVEHHLQEIAPIIQHFRGVLERDCPRFATREEWNAYLDDEVERVVLLRAHLEQAWYEATRTGDDDVRRTAKAPRKRVEEARALLGKLRSCANGNGAALNELAVWQRIEREVPQRQQEIALPQ
jgi:hypothetical protein